MHNNRLYAMSRLIACLVVVCICASVGGCGVSKSTFGAFRNQTRRQLSNLQSELNRLQRQENEKSREFFNNHRKLEGDITHLRSEIQGIARNQNELDSEVRKWLSKSETQLKEMEQKLKEMEDRVIEIRFGLHSINKKLEELQER